MSWLKLDMTKKTLLLIEDDRILDQVVLEPHNEAAEEYKLTVPFQWFDGENDPGAMVVITPPKTPPTT